MHTFLLIGILLTGIVLGHAVGLWVAARAWRLPKRGWKRALVIAFLHLVLAVALLALILSVGSDADRTLAVGFAGLAVDAAATVWLMRRLFGGKVGPVLGAWLVQLVVGGGMGLGVVLAMRPCLESFVNDTNSMAPNLRGPHYEDVLPNGNHLLIGVSVANPALGLRGGEPTGGIVAETYEFREVDRLGGRPGSPDRFVCNKTLAASRWDAVVIRNPRQPAVLYVKRLVGLPGERIVIRDGIVWVNGGQQTPPERLGPIRYRGSLGPDPDDPGSEEVVLGPDEFYVLGDNTHRSSDSRDFGPVRRDHLVGVADLIYWPPGRWRLRP